MSTNSIEDENQRNSQEEMESVNDPQYIESLLRKGGYIQSEEIPSRKLEGHYDSMAREEPTIESSPHKPEELQDSNALPDLPIKLDNSTQSLILCYDLCACDTAHLFELSTDDRMTVDHVTIIASSKNATYPDTGFNTMQLFKDKPLSIKYSECSYEVMALLKQNYKLLTHNALEESIISFPNFISAGDSQQVYRILSERWDKGPEQLIVQHSMLPSRMQQVVKRGVNQKGRIILTGDCPAMLRAVSIGIADYILKPEGSILILCRYYSAPYWKLILTKLTQGSGLPIEIVSLYKDTMKTRIKLTPDTILNKGIYICSLSKFSEFSLPKTLNLVILLDDVIPLINNYSSHAIKQFRSVERTIVVFPKFDMLKRKEKDALLSELIHPDVPIGSELFRLVERLHLVDLDEGMYSKSEMFKIEIGVFTSDLDDERLAELNNLGQLLEANDRVNVQKKYIGLFGPKKLTELEGTLRKQFEQSERIFNFSKKSVSSHDVDIDFSRNRNTSSESKENRFGVVPKESPGERLYPTEETEDEKPGRPEKMRDSSGRVQKEESIKAENSGIEEISQTPGGEDDAYVEEKGTVSPDHLPPGFVRRKDSETVSITPENGTAAPLKPQLLMNLDLTKFDPKNRQTSETKSSKNQTEKNSILAPEKSTILSGKILNKIKQENDKNSLKVGDLEEYISNHLFECTKSALHFRMLSINSETKISSVMEAIEHYITFKHKRRIIIWIHHQHVNEKVHTKIKEVIEKMEETQNLRFTLYSNCSKFKDRRNNLMMEFRRDPNPCITVMPILNPKEMLVGVQFDLMVFTELIHQTENVTNAIRLARYCGDRSDKDLLFFRSRLGFDKALWKKHEELLVEEFGMVKPEDEASQPNSDHLKRLLRAQEYRVVSCSRYPVYHGETEIYDGVCGIVDPMTTRSKKFAIRKKRRSENPTADIELLPWSENYKRTVREALAIQSSLRGGRPIEVFEQNGRLVQKADVVRKSGRITKQNSSRNSPGKQMSMASDGTLWEDVEIQCSELHSIVDEEDEDQEDIGIDEEDEAEDVAEGQIGENDEEFMSESMRNIRRMQSESERGEDDFRISLN